MLFGKKDLVKVKYQIRTAAGYELKNKKVSKEKLEELQNDASVKIIQIDE